MIYSFPLNVARDKDAIIATLAAPVESVSIARWALNQSGVATIHFGHGDIGRVITQEGQVWEFDPPLTDGVFVSCSGAGVGNMSIDINLRTFQTPQPVIDVTRARPGAPGKAWADQLLRNFGLKK